ncbi:ABC transporter ATP-binding protein [Leucobacter luti]|uniref:Amino acid/amide ABC transporter ATP-binding protein 1 (HAAT family) n=1 Tax=Leucobacter luti TaxID=340320 RepID=A0A4R6S7I2_9MICO|nr:ATP-binding cassette domain-containing protein [Leucobacter luti]MCW2288689.1 branched-chain amino acid transport system ATP-binding protein [Leucobacter luti]QYM75389.1 ATP-binding cassette domain-containing protein [Leucobacter luti]TCK45156.1 amino acid/amide ABC transporter ATP-binding protein 1 (HAAT family) [Leucobacter luti]TDP95681.1 amino acid/amide ABC transporter ATP-binding protein 1 (HAAT family) [Leucobacter luti]
MMQHSDTPPAGAGSLQGDSLSRAYSGVQALQDVSIEIPRGRVTGLIGANGAGKSTLVNILTGYDSPDSGRVIADDSDLTGVRPERRARRGVARTFQHGHLFSRCTVLENVEVTAIACGAAPKQARAIAQGLIEELQLGDWMLHDADRLPHGVERRLGVARALATRPSYVLLDEPAAGLNDGEAAQLRESMRDVAARNVGVLLIDHNMPLIFSSCDYIYVLGAGKNVLDGSPDQVRHDERLASSYLGSAAQQISEGPLA